MKKTSTAYLLLFAGIFSLCIFSFLFYQRIQLLVDSYAMVNRSTQVYFQADNLFLNLRDAATNYRDYLNAHDKNLLNEFNKNLSEYSSTFKTLNQLETGNYIQQEKLQQLNILAQDYISFMHHTAGDNKIQSPAITVFDSVRSKLGKIRVIVNDINNNEAAVMQTRSNELNKHIVTTPLFLLIFSLLSLAIIIYAFLSIIKQIKRNKLLEINEARLRESEERFRQLADLIPQIVWMARTDGYIDYYNKRWYEYTGSNENFGDQSWVPILHPDDVPTCIDAWYNSVKTGIPFLIEYRFKDKNNPGNYRWFLGKALPIKNKNGEVVKWFGTCTDIHDQKTNTEKLELLVKERAAELTAKNKDLNEAQRLAHIGSWEWNIKENKIFWSDELYHIYGLSRENFKTDYESYIDQLYKDDRAYSKKVIEEALAQRKSFEFYHRIERPDGNMRTVHGRGEVYVDENNEPVRMAGTAQDITESIEIQNKINELNQTFNFAEQTSLTGSFRYNFSTATFTYSDNLYRILGCKPGEFEPTLENFIRFVYPKDLEYILSENHELNEEDISNEYLFRVIKKDNSIIHVRNTGIFITENNEKVYIGTLQDVTIQHNKELQMIEQNAALEKMNKELASFSYVASHDLQEPLRKIKMFTKRLVEKEIESMSTDSKGFFKRIENAATRMQQLIDDLLSYSRTNIIHTQFETINLDKLLEEVSDILSEKILQTNAVIESSGLETADVIPFQFQQLLTNLITNSMKFARKDVSPHIRISHSILAANNTNHFPEMRETNYHHYIISDNGIGFEPQYNEKVFELFQRLHGRNEFEGTGIGLAICKKIAENHNGFITANGNPNKGATFNIYIPIEQ